MNYDVQVRRIFLRGDVEESAATTCDPRLERGGIETRSAKKVYKVECLLLKIVKGAGNWWPRGDFAKNPSVPFAQFLLLKSRLSLSCGVQD